MARASERGRVLAPRVESSTGTTAIEAATLVIAGHADGYRNMAFRAFERLHGPEAAALRPVEPHEPAPVDARTADRPRPGDDRLVAPMARRAIRRSTPARRSSIFVRRWTDPSADLDTYAGEWRAEPAWPPARLVEDREARSASAAPRRASGRTTSCRIRGDVGVTGSIWCAAVASVRTRRGTSARTRRSRSSTTGRSTPGVEIMGHPRVELHRRRRRRRSRSCRRSSATCAPDGTSALVTRGHPEPHAPCLARAPRGPVRGRAGARRRSSWTPRPTSSSRGTGSDSTWPRATSRPRGRRPPRARSTVDRAGSTPLPPDAGRPAGRAAADVRAGSCRGQARRSGPVGDPRGRAGAASGRRDRPRRRARPGRRSPRPRTATRARSACGGTTPGTARASGRRGARAGLARGDGPRRVAGHPPVRSRTWHLEIELEVYDGDERIAERRWERTTARDLQ